MLRRSASLLGYVANDAKFPLAHGKKYSLLNYIIYKRIGEGEVNMHCIKSGARDPTI